jgi:hypothetical protein
MTLHSCELFGRRHFLPVAVLKRVLDALPYVKINVLHWHIVDNQSFPSKSSSSICAPSQVVCHPIHKAAQQLQIKPELNVGRKPRISQLSKPTTARARLGSMPLFCISSLRGTCHFRVEISTYRDWHVCSAQSAQSGSGS